MATTHSLQGAAQAWCDPRTSHIVMDPVLAEVFAEMLDRYKEVVMLESVSNVRCDFCMSPENWK